MILLSVLLSLLSDIHKSKHVSDCGATIVASTYLSDLVFLFIFFSLVRTSVNFGNSFSAHSTLPSWLRKTEHSARLPQNLLEGEHLTTEVNMYYIMRVTFYVRAGRRRFVVVVVVFMVSG